MARGFLDPIRTRIAALYVTGGGIEAPTEGSLMLDLLDSSIQDEAAIASNISSIAVPTAVAWTPLTTGIYDTSVGGDADFLKVDVVAGTITTSATAGFTYILEGVISFSDVSSNTAIEFSILADGVQVGFIAAMTGGGGARPRTASFSHVILSASTNAVYTIGVQTPAAINSIDIISIGLSATIQPTNNP